MRKFEVGKTYRALSTGRSDSGKWKCVKRTEQFVTFEQGYMILKRKIRAYKGTEYVEVVNNSHGIEQIYAV